MSKKILLQLFLSFLMLIGIFGTFFYYKKDVEKVSVNEVITKDISTNNSSSNIIENINYSSTDLNGNKYEIDSLKGTIDLTDSSIIFMTDVTAKISLITSDIINISSKYAKYNSKNYETTFSENITIDYLEHKINCNDMSLSLINNLLTLYGDVIYSSDLMFLKADRIEIDLITKNSTIFMNNKTKKITAVGK